MEEVSIIVPMFNCEKSIAKLITSLLKQTYKNIEILLVNDGCTDRTLEICRSFSSDSRMKILFRKHGGVSRARNTGIKEAHGKFIYFCDADDYIELDTIEKMVKAYQKNNVDLVISGHSIEVYLKDNKPYIKNVYYPEKIYHSREEFKKDFILLWEKPLLATVWNKLYVTDIIKNNNIFFENYDFGEDIKFNMKYFLNISSVHIISDILYHYIKKENNSLTQKYINNLFEIYKTEYTEFCDFFDLYGISKNDYEEYLHKRYLECMIRCLKNLTKPSCPLNFKTKLKETRKIINNYLTRICVKNATFDSVSLKLVNLLFKLKLSLLTLLIFSFLNFIKQKVPKTFSFIKKIFN